MFTWFNYPIFLLIFIERSEPEYIINKSFSWIFFSELPLSDLLSERAINMFIVLATKRSANEQ